MIKINQDRISNITIENGHRAKRSLEFQFDTDGYDQFLTASVVYRGQRFTTSKYYYKSSNKNNCIVSIEDGINMAVEELQDKVRRIYLSEMSEDAYSYYIRPEYNEIIAAYEEDG